MQLKMFVFLITIISVVSLGSLSTASTESINSFQQNEQQKDKITEEQSAENNDIKIPRRSHSLIDDTCGLSCGIGAGVGLVSFVTCLSALVPPYIYLLDDVMQNDWGWKYSYLLTSTYTVANFGVKCWMIYELAILKDKNFIIPYASIVGFDAILTFSLYLYEWNSNKYKMKNRPNREYQQVREVKKFNFDLYPRIYTDEISHAKIDGINATVSYSF